MHFSFSVQSMVIFQFLAKPWEFFEYFTVFYRNYGYFSVSKITFTVGPIRQEDLSTPELNKLMAMAQRFDITFDTVPILDSDQNDKLG